MKRRHGDQPEETRAVASLRRRLAAAQQTIAALLAGQLDIVLDPHSASAVMLREADDELRHLDREMRRSEAYFRSLIENLSDLVTIIVPDGTIQYVSPSILAVLGYRPEERLGRRAFDLVHPDDAERVTRYMAEAIETSQAAGRITYRYRHKDGSWRHLESAGVNLLADPGVSGILVVSHDITEQVRAEEALRQSEAAYRVLVEHAPLGIYRSTRDGRLLAVNPALVAMLGYASREEVLRLNVSRDVYADGAQRQRLKAEAEHRGAATIEAEWKRKDGNRIVVRVHARPVCAPGGEVLSFDALAEDVTEQRSLERQFLQAQKMEAVGRLAGGVAHDFNNQLTAITGCSDLLLEELGPDNPQRADVEEIRAAAHRAASLTRQLLIFSRRQVVQMRVLDLNTVVQELDKMLRRLIGEDLTLEISLTEAATLVRADASQLEQVIVNLVVNARDAMPSGGVLTIETEEVELGDSYAHEHRDVAPGRYCMLAVSDTGVGMDAEVLSHVFEPFFTTKEPGKGTGLGLATVYGIVRQSGGWVWAYSEPGQGAVFKIYWPRVDDAVEPSEGAALAQPAQGGHETVLLVEDDAAVRQVVSRALSQKGYTVLTAPGGTAALDLTRGRQQAIDLLLTDLVMPGLTGPELAAALRAERPGLRVLFMSGYTDDAAIQRGLLDASIPYLQKPFTSGALSRKVREVLDGPEPRHDPQQQTPTG